MPDSRSPLETGALIEVEVVYAKPEEQMLVALKVAEGATIEQTIQASGLVNRFPEIDFSLNRVGIFGGACSLDQTVKHADRVEIYRPLIHDPKDARRQRAAKK